MSCTGICGNACSGNCTASCKGSCTATCADDCTGGCKGGCNTTCNTGCNTTCTATCANDCTGGCKTTCTGTCSGDCNNACLSSSASATIANLGANIKNHGQVQPNDFIELKNAITYEISRRNYDLSSAYDYSVQPASGVPIYREYAQKIFDEVHYFNSAKTPIVTDGIIRTSDFTDTISYIQSLMSANVK
jgi:hypothetical protein